MYKIKEIIKRAFIFTVIITFFCLIYTLAVTLIAQCFFQKKANGSLIEKDGIKYGSLLIGQNFTSNIHLWGRFDKIQETYKEPQDSSESQVSNSKASNISPVSVKYKKIIDQRLQKIKNAHSNDLKVPVELVTGSASGLDPHISYDAAVYQAQRIAKNRNLSLDKVVEIIDKCSEKKFLGIFGEKIVNVLLVNLYLEGIL